MSHGELTLEQQFLVRQSEDAVRRAIASGDYEEVVLLFRSLQTHYLQRENFLCQQLKQKWGL